MPYAKNVIKVKVPNRSGFDKSHRNSGTGKCGMLLPLLFDEVIPNSRISLKINLATQLPPLVSDTYMNLRHKVEAFFVPGRLLCKSYEPWFCDTQQRFFSTNSVTNLQQDGGFHNALPAIPCISFATGSSAPSSISVGAGSLLDYLGYGRNSMQGETINMLPLIAYHLVWQEYYRNPRVQNPAFVPDLGYKVDDISASYPRIASIPYQFFNYLNSDLPANYLFTISSSNANSFVCADGVSLFDIRQRNFGLDYFTGARPSAQQGSAASVSMQVPSGGGSTQFTIAQLRAANSLQMFRERNNLPSTRLVDQVKARYGANLSDGVAQRPICIGSCTYDYGSTGISQTAPNNDDPSGSLNNLFQNIGAQYGRAYSSGKDFIIDDFVANEPGYILVLHSQVPLVTYSTGVDPLFKRYIGEGSIVEMANPLLQNVGDQPIYQNELSSGNSSTAVFGYTDRYADFMYKKNVVHGLMRAGQTLSNYVLQRGSLSGATLSTAFLEIPRTYLDNVMQVTSNSSGLSFWYDALLEYKVSMPLAEYSIPSLQDPAYEHGSSVNLRRNGQIF